MSVERRRVHLLVPDAAFARLMVDRDGRPPVLSLEFAAGRTTFGALAAELAAMGIETPIVDLLIDQTEPSADDPTPTHEVVCELEPFDALPGGWRWDDIGSVRPSVATGLQRYVDVRFAEWCDGAAVPEHRSPWAFRGWFAGFRDWVADQVADAGGGPLRSMVAHRMWGISAVFRVEAEHGVFWAKAVYAGFVHEPAITRLLDRLFPGTVPGVVAAHSTNGWMLLRHLDGVLVSTQFERTADAVRALVAVQADAVSHCDELLAAGAVLRPLDGLADALRDAFERPLTRTMVEPSAHDVERILAAIRPAIAEVRALGLPELTLVHGDFHASNVMLFGDQVTVFDWSDAALSHPLVDIGAWQAWFVDDAAALDHLWQTFAEAWGELVEPERVLAVRRSLDLVVGAYHFVTYTRIPLRLEPLRQDEALSGARTFLQQMLASL